ncbi:MAG TPA: TonB-dependent receptor [Steroidobacteraceae bacterium]|nr:TonB-dependent receptor [Steroidobacteraceae bacterium]
MLTLRLRSVLLLAATASLGSSFAAFAVDNANDAAPAAETTAANANANTPELQEITVTGIRASLEKSLEIKKDASVVLDSINATEMGRFPDADVADSLEHLPGITIDRTTGGEGIHVNVRGLGPQYNITTLNNRILASDDDSRDLAFDVLPSEIISGADVLKSTQASALEGSIGGTVNLRTASPFDNPGFHGGVHAEGNDNDMSDLKGSKFSAFVSDTNDDRTLGFLLGAVHSDTKIRTDSLNAYNQNIYGPTTFPFTDPNGAPLAATPCCITFGSIFDDKKRDALSGSLEWRPSSDLKIVADGLWTHLNDPQIGYNESYYFPSPDSIGTTWSNPVVNNGVVTGITVSQFQPEMVNNTVDRVVTTSMFGLNVEWKPTDKLSFTADGYRSTANRPEGGQDSFVTAGLVSNTPYAPDTLIFSDVPNSLPNFNVLVPPSQLGLTACPKGTASSTSPGSCSYTALMNSGFLNNNNYWSTHYDGLNGYSVHDQITGFTLDGKYDVGLGWFNKILFGAGYSDRDKSRTDISNDWTNGSGQYGTLYQTAGCPIQCEPYSFGAQGFPVISMVSLPNFMQGAGGSYPTTLPQLNVGQLLAFLKSLNGKPNPFFCSSLPCSTPFDFSQTLPQPNPYNSYDVTEKTFSVYGELTFAGTNWGGNVGLRVVRTNTTASTAIAAPVSLWTPSINSSTETWNVQYAAGQDSLTEGHYVIPLPSANFNYWVVPEKVQLRAALAETMSRPDLAELAPTSSNNASNGQPQLSYGGTAGLKPIRATQVDFSAEWYYHPHSAFTVALFGKKIRDDIYTGTLTNVNLGTISCVGGPPPASATVTCSAFPWTITEPANGAKSTFYGVELAWQHIMDNGFGAHLQYTRTENKSYDQNGNSIGAINAVPPMTMSAGLLYEKGPISADVNWDYAASFQVACSQCTEVPGWPAISSPFQWLTATFHYKFTKEFQVYVEGKNLTDSVARSYLNGNPLLPWAPGQAVGQSSSGVGTGYSSYGRTYTVGASYQF